MLVFPYNKSLEENRNKSSTYITLSDIYSQDHTKWGKAESMSPKTKNETRGLIPSLLLHTVPHALVKAVLQKKERNGTQARKAEVPLFTDCMVLHLKDPTASFLQLDLTLSAN